MRGLRISGGLAVIALLAAACGSARTQPFRPTGSLQAGLGTSAPSAPSRTIDGLAWPPFGPQAHVIMPGWTPAQASEDPAVMANKDFLLALVYAEYRGNQDTRWRAYVSPRIRAALGAQLAQPDVTTESFTGTIRFSHMRAFPDPVVKGAIDVAQCFDNSQTTNTSIRTGRPVPDHTPPGQHYYRTTNVLAPDQAGNWQVVSMYPAVYYPRAPECKP